MSHRLEGRLICWIEFSPVLPTYRVGARWFAHKHVQWAKLLGAQTRR
jgi:hypothetical protein